jgi:Uma2 family endonuclease
VLLVLEVSVMAIAVTHRRFTVNEYYRMAEVGILSPDERVELIEGEIVDMAPIGSRHAACVDRLNRDFVPALGDRAIVRVQGPLRLHDYSEPEPDLVILRPRDDFYAEETPGPADALLVIEVADTSERYDRQVKVPLYAQAGIPEVWLVDLTAGNITVYRGPGPDGYAEATVATGADELSPLAFPDFVLTAARILG